VEIAALKAKKIGKGTEGGGRSKGKAASRREMFRTHRNTEKLAPKKPAIFSNKCNNVLNEDF